MVWTVFFCMISSGPVARDPLFRERENLWAFSVPLFGQLGL